MSRAHLTVNAENVLYKNCYVNATNTDPDVSRTLGPGNTAYFDRLRMTRSRGC